MFDSASTELETLRQSLEAARTDNSRLHQESELVVANVNQWIKEQNHLQETKEALTTEVQKMKAELRGKNRK